jgi:N-hydroxyarylamine O-acetyltransferase
MNNNQLQTYLDRIQYQELLSPDIQTLIGLHRKHLLNIPFENLDIQWGRPLSLELEQLHNKIIGQQRGGFCYEMNHLFGWLLASLGFEVQRIAAQVHNEEKPGDYFDHMALVVNNTWLCDIGFGGGSFMEPLSLETTQQQKDAGGTFQIEHLSENQWLLSSRLKATEPMKPVYYFDLTPRKIAEFEPECIRKQQDPQSSFVTRKICTMATPDGRVSLLNEELTIRTGDNKRVMKIQNLRQEAELLWQHFGIRSPWFNDPPS